MYEYVCDMFEQKLWIIKYNLNSILLYYYYYKREREREREKVLQNLILIKNLIFISKPHEHKTIL